MKFKTGQTIRIGSTTAFGKVVGFSKDKKFYKIQWLSPQPHPSSMIKTSNQSIRLCPHFNKVDD